MYEFQFGLKVRVWFVESVVYSRGWQNKNNVIENQLGNSVLGRNVTKKFKTIENGKHQVIKEHQVVRSLERIGNAQSSLICTI